MGILSLLAHFWPSLDRMGDSSHPSEEAASSGHPEEKPYLPELGWEEWHYFSSSISSSVKKFTRRHTLGMTA